MRILYHIPYPNGIGDDRTIFDGYKFAFEDMGHKVFPLTERHALEDRLAEVNPDLFISSLNVVNPLRNASTLRAYRNGGGAVFLKAGVIEKSANALIRLIREDMLADIYTTELEFPQFFELTGRKLRMLPLAASRQYHFPVKPTEEYACDILFIGANLPKKRALFERRLLPLAKKYKVNVFGTGWDWWDRGFLKPFAKVERKLFGSGVVSEYRIRRQVPYEEENQAYASAKISLNFHEEMEGGFYLLNGRTFKIPACGGFEICDYVPLARKFFNEDELVMAKDDKDFSEKVDYYMSHPNERDEIRRKGTERALADHTYHNRVEMILDWHKEVKGKA